MATLDGNYAQHIQNGGCPAIHPNGRHFCSEPDGHYDWFSSRHVAHLFSLREGTETLLWN